MKCLRSWCCNTSFEVVGQGRNDAASLQLIGYQSQLNSRPGQINQSKLELVYTIGNIKAVPAAAKLHRLDQLHS